MTWGLHRKFLGGWSVLAIPRPNSVHTASEGEVLQPPTVASIWCRSAAQPLGWVQGRSALPGELFINSIVGPYCVSFGGGS